MIPEAGERSDFKETLLSLEMGQCATCLQPFVLEPGGDNLVCSMCLNSVVLTIIGSGIKKAYVVDITKIPPSMEQVTIGQMRQRLRDAQSPLRKR